MTPAQKKFKARNGDDLATLLKAKKLWDEMVREKLVALALADMALKNLRDSIDFTTGRRASIDERLKVWRDEYKKAHGK